VKFGNVVLRKEENKKRRATHANKTGLRLEPAFEFMCFAITKKNVLRTLYRAVRSFCLGTLICREFLNGDTPIDLFLMVMESPLIEVSLRDRVSAMLAFPE